MSTLTLEKRSFTLPTLYSYFWKARWDDPIAMAGTAVSNVVTALSIVAASYSEAGERKRKPKTEQVESNRQCWSRYKEHYKCYCMPVREKDSVEMLVFEMERRNQN